MLMNWPVKTLVGISWVASDRGLGQSLLDSIYYIYILGPLCIEIFTLAQIIFTLTQKTACKLKKVAPSI